jgi:putative ABC transport system permease protein
MRTSLSLYRLLVKLYPAKFREEYGGPLQRQFQDDYAEVRSGPQLVRFWARTLADFARSMPQQLAREVGQDTRYAIRGWIRHPISILFSVSVLAIAIGVNTGIFSVVNGLLLRSLPFSEPERLGVLQRFGVPARTAPEFHAWHRSSPYLADAASFLTGEVNAEASGQGARMRLTETTANWFSVLGVRVAAGRPFADGEDSAGHDNVAVISHGLWQRLFGGEPTAIGSSLRVNGSSLTVIGIAPPGFDYPERTDVWSPTAFDFRRIPKTGSAFFPVTLGRLTPGMTWAQARQAFEAEAFRGTPGPAATINGPALIPLREQLAGAVKQASLLLMAGVGLLLLLACANVTNLLLARTMSRSHELVIRTALGASRARLTQQMVTEALLLSGLATLLGLIVAVWTADAAASVQPAQLSAQAYAVLDWRVLAFAEILSLGTGLVFGVGPAVYASRATYAGGARHHTSSTAQSRLRNLLVVTQIAVTIVLLAGSVALGRAFVALTAVPYGYDFTSVATLSVSLAGTRHESGDRPRAYYADVFSRVERIPGVTSVSATESLPLSVEGVAAGTFSVDGGGRPTLAPILQVAPSYFSTIGASLLAGREFTAEDLIGSERLAIVSEPFARQFGDPSAVVGKTITAGAKPARTIIGVVRGMRYAGPAFDPGPLVFWLSQSPRATTIVVRVNGPASDRIPSLREAVQSIDPGVSVYNVGTLNERLDSVLARPRFYTTAVLFFGGLALVLALIGVYGVLSYSLVQRTREMGVRLALGTTPGRLRAMLLKQTLQWVGAGVVAGTLLATAAAGYLHSLVQGADAAIATTTALAVAVTTVLAAAAIWSATRHIGRLDIADVLRAAAAD